MGLDEFARRYPERHVEVGIAEQNLVTVAAGLAASGRTVIVATYATFASMRALEQLRTFVAYPNLRVVIVAALAGLSGSLEGVAHLALEDVGILRTVPGLTILNPADAVETRALVRAAASHAGPVYIRLGRDESAVLFAEEWTCGIGAAQVLRRGKAARADAVLLTTGLATAVTLEAVEHLSARGLHCDVVEFPTLKPMDHAAILSARARSSVVITIEEHSLVGGLGTAVMECLSETAPTMVHRIGLPDQFHGSGSPTELRERFGLTGAAVAARVRSLIDAALPAQDDERA
jgi:transketolase